MKIASYELGALGLITVAIIVRVIFISYGWPTINSDEATMGLHALHIITRGERPLFFYGQSYMGTIQAYLGAFFFLLLGPSTFALRLGLVVLYAGFLLALYVLTRLLYPKGVALTTVFFLCLGSSDTLIRQLMAIGGYLETLLFGTLSLLLAYWLALSFRRDAYLNEQRKRLVAYGCLGGVIGLGLWSDMLILPFVSSSLLLLLLFCRCELRTRASLFWLLGLLVGSFPLLLFNIQYPLENALITLWNLHSLSGTSLAGQNPALSLALSLLGTIVISIPMATGANPLCMVSAESGRWIQQFSLSCMGFQACWGLGMMIVWLLAMFALSRELQERRRAFCSASGFAAEKGLLVRCSGRLMLLGCAGLTVLSYLTSPAAAIFPVTSSRYLVGLLVATPALIGFLWPSCSQGLSAFAHYVTSRQTTELGCVHKMQECREQSPLPGDGVSPLKNSLYGSKRQSPRQITPKRVYIANIVKICLLCFTSLILLLGTTTSFGHIADAQKLTQRENTLTIDLLGLHARHIYSDYWTCNRLIFLSNERIICSVLDTNLSPGQNRYARYAQIVQQDPSSAYVFDLANGNTTGVAQEKAFAERFRTQYHHRYVVGYAIYVLPSQQVDYVRAHDHQTSASGYPCHLGMGFLTLKGFSPPQAVVALARAVRCGFSQ